jgi:steroid delta-isomerase
MMPRLDTLLKHVFVKRALAGFLLVGLAAAAAAQPAPEAEIRKAFAQWTEDFNAARTDKVCDLFSRELRSDYRGQKERGYDGQCAILQRSLTDPARRYAYALAIREIQVWGDIAMARITWTLTVRDTATGRDTIVTEPGLDIFRREADGRWRIIRYIAYDE